MAYVITEACKDEKAGDCVEVCPVDCIEDGGDQFYIDPETCIDCGACAPACPVEAIYHESDLPEEYEEYLDKAAAYFNG